MNARRLQGLALMLSAVCLLLGLLGLNSSLGPVVTIIGILLFMLGIPAIQAVQPTGWLGVAGIVLLELGALIALGFRLDLVSASLASGLSLTSALLGMLGAVIVGWLTTREHVFPGWVGWAFLFQGLLNFISGMFDFGSL